MNSINIDNPLADETSRTESLRLGVLNFCLLNQCSQYRLKLEKFILKC